MNHIPTNHFTPLDNADLSLVPPTTRQCGSLGKEIPVYLGGLSSDFNLALDVIITPVLYLRVFPKPLKVHTIAT